MRHTTKPRLTEEQKVERVTWSQNWRENLADNEFNNYYCFLDEKWFFTTSQRKKLKILPQAEFETCEDADVNLPKLRSRRFPVKVMFMGVVARPVPEHDFNGKIYLD